jgi:hypothetical protein
VGVPAADELTSAASAATSSSRGRAHLSEVDVGFVGHPPEHLRRAEQLGGQLGVAFGEGQLGSELDDPRHDRPVLGGDGRLERPLGPAFRPFAVARCQLDPGPGDQQHGLALPDVEGTVIEVGDGGVEHLPSLVQPPLPAGDIGEGVPDEELLVLRADLVGDARGRRQASSRLLELAHPGVFHGEADHDLPDVLMVPEACEDLHGLLEGRHGGGVLAPRGAVQCGRDEQVAKPPALAQLPEPGQAELQLPLGLARLSEVLQQPAGHRMPHRPDPRVGMVAQLADVFEGGRVVALE